MCMYCSDGLHTVGFNFALTYALTPLPKTKKNKTNSFDYVFDPLDSF